MGMYKKKWKILFYKNKSLSRFLISQKLMHLNVLRNWRERVVHYSFSQDIIWKTYNLVTYVHTYILHIVQFRGACSVGGRCNSLSPGCGFESCIGYRDDF